MTEAIVKMQLKKERDPFKRSISNNNFQRLKHYDESERLSGSAKLTLVLEVHKLVFDFKSVNKEYKV